MKTVILDTPYHLSLLARLGEPSCQQPEVSRLIHALYDSLFSHVSSATLETETMQIPTRMHGKDDRGIYSGIVFKKEQKVVVADLIRAGIEPSTLFYHKLTEILDPKGVRQDHIMAQRVEGEHGVTDTSLMASKIGGSIENATVFLPDPMGATGHSMEKVIEFYLTHYGKPKQFVGVHLIITPEYIERMQKIDAPISIYAARKDAGLTNEDYIYPGLGGVGEMISNTMH